MTLTLSVIHPPSPRDYGFCYTGDDYDDDDMTQWQKVSPEAHRQYKEADNRWEDARWALVKARKILFERCPNCRDARGLRRMVHILPHPDPSALVEDDESEQDGNGTATNGEKLKTQK